MRHLLFLFLAFFTVSLSAQDTAYVKRMVEKLASAKMAGRGYVKKGDKRAAALIASEFKKAGLSSLPGGWFQHFDFEVNRFPDDVEFKAGDKELQAGVDFIVAPGSPCVKGTFGVVTINREILSDSSRVSGLIRENFTGKFILLDDRGMEDEEKEFFRKLQANPFKADGLIILKEKLTWSVSTTQSAYPVIEVNYNSWPGAVSQVELEIESELVRHKTSNVLAYVPGTEHDDSFVVFTAHYDHLGMLGDEAIFYGANDNASGVATILDLARHYKKNPLPYSVLFIAFAGEEAGLLGSYHYVKNPVVPLEKMSVLINLDLMGNGSEGIMVVNGAVFEEDFERMNSINEEFSLLPEVKKRGKAANSDHYFFTESGVKAFFIYSLGGSKAYHDVFDVPGSIRFDEYQDIFRLITTYVKRTVK